MTIAAAPALQVHAAWILVVTFSISLVYELWRATAKAGTSRHDSMQMFVATSAVLYGSGAVVVAVLFADVAGAAWIGLVYVVVLILVSVGYYNPRVIVERRPGLVDWVEDLVYTGLLFVAAALLVYEVVGRSLE